MRSSLAETTTATLARPVVLRRPLTLATVMLLAMVLIGYGLGSYALFDNNEGLYATVVEDMLANGHWLMPHLNGVAYPEKPPLFYYALASSFALFGVGEWSARVVSALSAALCVAFVFRFTRRQSGSTAVGGFAALITVSSVGLVMLARTVMPDALLLLCFTVAMLGSFDAWTRCSELGYGVSLVALALAVLTKGLLAVVLFGLVWAIYVAFTWWRSRAEALAQLRFLLAPVPVLAFVVIALPWHVLAVREYDGFAWMYFWNEHVLRFLGQRIPNDTYSGSFLYYLPRIALLFFPWIVFMPRAACTSRAPQHAALDRFCATAGMVVFAFFSISSAKANYYIALALPFFAVWLAVRLATTARDHDAVQAPATPRLIELWVLALLTLVMIVAALWAVSREVEWQVVVARGDWHNLVMGGTLLLAAVIATVLVIRSANSLWLTPAFATVMVLSLALAVAQMLEGKLSVRKILITAQAQCARCTLMLFHDYESVSAVSFYSEQALLLVIDSTSADLWWGREWARGTDAEAASFVSSEDVFARSQRGEAIMVLVPRGERAVFAASPLALHATLLARRGGNQIFQLHVPLGAQMREVPLP